MNTVSALLRLACGGVILLLAWTSWGKTNETITAGKPVELFGQTIQADGASITLAFGLIAVLLVAARLPGMRDLLTPIAREMIDGGGGGSGGGLLSPLPVLLLIAFFRLAPRS